MPFLYLVAIAVFAFGLDALLSPAIIAAESFLPAIIASGVPQ